MLEVRNLTVANSDGYEIVKDMSFTVRAGEIFAIAGVAGNGQVEVADAIFGLIAVKSGSISINGADITKSAVRERVELGIAYIPEDRQAYGLILDFSLSENLAMRKYYKPPFCVRSFLRRERFDRNADNLIAAYDIRSGEGARTPMRSMSGGNQQKAIIAREIDQNAPLILFVQPTRGLDVGATISIRERMIAQRAAGKAVLLISLELDEIVACADTVGVIYNGKMNKCAPMGEIGIEEIGEYMMGVKQ